MDAQPKVPDAYLEDRLSLVEEMFAQLLGGVPEAIAAQIAGVYNTRRAAIMKHHFPDLPPPEVPAAPEKSRIITFPY